MPRLILQPLVENAIKHGIAPRSGQGLVQISAQSARTQGLDRSARQRRRLEQERPRAGSRNGVGLSNTRARLDCLYGDEHALDFADGSGGLAGADADSTLQRVVTAPADSSLQVALA